MDKQCPVAGRITVTYTPVCSQSQVTKMAGGGGARNTHDYNWKSRQFPGSIENTVSHIVYPSPDVLAWGTEVGGGWEWIFWKEKRGLRI